MRPLLYRYKRVLHHHPLCCCVSLLLILLLLLLVIGVAVVVGGCRCCGGAEHKFRDPADVIYPLLHHGYMRGEGAEALVSTRLGLFDRSLCCRCRFDIVHFFVLSISPKTRQDTRHNQTEEHGIKTRCKRNIMLC
eukprot:COSAG06_NODE_4648_length_4068_cov_2.547493_4_plen_135_part_00